MVILWWTSQSGGTHPQPMLGCTPCARGRSGLPGHPRGARPAPRPDRQSAARYGCRWRRTLPGVHARRGSEPGTEHEGSAGNITLRHGRRKEVRLEEVAPDRRTYLEGLLEASARCQSASAHRQGCAACRVRAGVAPIFPYFGLCRRTWRDSRLVALATTSYPAFASSHVVSTSTQAGVVW